MGLGIEPWSSRRASALSPKPSLQPIAFCLSYITEYPECVISIVQLCPSVAAAVWLERPYLNMQQFVSLSISLSVSVVQCPATEQVV